MTGALGRVGLGDAMPRLLTPLEAQDTGSEVAVQGVFLYRFPFFLLALTGQRLHGQDKQRMRLHPLEMHRHQAKVAWPRVITAMRPNLNFATTCCPTE